MYLSAKLCDNKMNRNKMDNENIVYIEILY